MTYDYAALAAINVNDHVEKKGGLSYLSWVWAVDQLFRVDPSATWEIQFFDGKPYSSCGEYAMVFCKLNACGVTRMAFLPVMDHRNKPIANPDSFQINSALQRCLTKAIAHLGIGLYIYAGEDLPPGDEPPAEKKTKQSQSSASADDLSSIRLLMAAAGITEEQITKKLGIESLELLPSAKVREVVARLQEIISMEEANATAK